MSYASHISAMTDLARSEGGIFTTAQAARLGPPRDALSHACSAGRLERVARGAYRLAGAGAGELDLAVALWKLTDPAAFAHERMADWDGIAVGGRTAAFALGIGNMHPYPCRIYGRRPMRPKTGVAYARRVIDRADVAFRSGMPVTGAERTVYDMALDREDPSMVADALADAARRAGGIDDRRLRDLFGGASGRWGKPPYGLDLICAHGQRERGR